MMSQGRTLGFFCPFLESKYFYPQVLNVKKFANMGKGGRALAKKKVDRKERMDEIQQKLVQGTLDIFNSDKFADYISAMAKFPSYSINKGYWRISNSPILSKSLDNQTLNSLGFIYFTDYYSKVCVN